MSESLNGSSNGQQNGKTAQNGAAVNTLNSMYQDYFLDYASYVILERAVPAINFFSAE